MKINFDITNQILSTSFKDKVIADSKNYLIAHFNFHSTEWKNQLVFALFSYEGNTYKKILGAETDLEFNECYIPPEVIHSPRFSVSIYCADRITTNAVKINVEASGYTEDIINGKTTPTVVEQMESLMKKYALLCNQILQDCDKIKEEIKNGN